MGRLYFLMICLFSFVGMTAQEKLSKEEKERREKNIQAANPFKQFGYKGKVATLSKGKYLEVHDLDSIVTIGSVRFHVDKKEIVGAVETDTINKEYARPMGDVASRWLSPDPLGEEYRRWSPYAFGVDNPLRFTDPDGRSVKDVIIIGKEKDKALAQLQSSSQNLNISMDKKGKVTATAKEGATLTSAEQTLQAATTDKNVTVTVNATNKNTTGDTVIIGGLFDGNKIQDGKVSTSQIVNPNQAEIIDGAAKREAGVTTLHEVLESYVAGVETLKTGVAAPSNKDVSTSPQYEAAHAQAEELDSRHQNNYRTHSPPGSNEVYIVPSKGLMKLLFKL